MSTWRIAPERLRHTLWALHIRRIDPWLCDLTGWTLCIYPPACGSRRLRRHLRERTAHIRACGHKRQRPSEVVNPRLRGEAFVCEDCGIGILKRDGVRG